MSRRDLEELLERLEDTREIVLGPAAEPSAGGAAADIHAVWRDARQAAARAYATWRASPGADAYAAYRAAADREDAAAAALAHAARRPA